MTTLVFAAVALFLFFMLGTWARRGGLPPDPPGVRTLCTFSREGHDGMALLGAIAAALRTRGVAVDDPVEEDAYIWALSAELEGRSNYIQLAYVEDDGNWVLTAVDGESGGPCVRALLPLLEAALGAGLVTDVTWHRRDLFVRGDRTSARPTPLD